MEVTHLHALCAILLIHHALGSAQFYGSYGRNSYFAPITFPQPQSRAAIPIPLESRLGADVQPEIQKSSTQISRGSEQFSFEMFYVSCWPKIANILFIFPFFLLIHVINFRPLQMQFKIMMRIL